MASTATQFDTDCVLMLHTDVVGTAFADSSVNAKTMTAVNQAQITNAVSKFPPASAVFDGIGDIVTAGDSPDWAFGTNDFTIDLWSYINAFENGVLIDIGGGVGSGIRLYLADSKIMQIILNNASVYNSGALTLSATTWYHFAVTRSGTNLRFFQDGVQIGATVTDSTNISGGTSGLKIADGFGDYIGLDYNGRLQEIRAVKGTAVWTANFTPPSAPYTQVPIVVSGGSAPVIRKRRNMMGVGL